LMAGVETWLRSQAADFFDTGIQKLIPRYKCLYCGGDYVEKYRNYVRFFVYYNFFSLLFLTNSSADVTFRLVVVLLITWFTLWQHIVEPLHYFGKLLSCFFTRIGNVYKVDNILAYFLCLGYNGETKL
jgi:hypothetical protein